MTSCGRLGGHRTEKKVLVQSTWGRLSRLYHVESTLEGT